MYIVSRMYSYGGQITELVSVGNNPSSHNINYFANSNNEQNNYDKHGKITNDYIIASVPTKWRRTINKLKKHGFSCSAKAYNINSGNDICVLAKKHYNRIDICDEIVLNHISSSALYSSASCGLAYISFVNDHKITSMEFKNMIKTFNNFTLDNGIVVAVVAGYGLPKKIKYLSLNGFKYLVRPSKKDTNILMVKCRHKVGKAGTPQYGSFVEPLFND